MVRFASWYLCKVPGRAPFNSLWLRMSRSRLRSQKIVLGNDDDRWLFGALNHASHISMYPSWRRCCLQERKTISGDHAEKLLDTLRFSKGQDFQERHCDWVSWLLSPCRMSHSPLDPAHIPHLHPQRSKLTLMDIHLKVFNIWISTLKQWKMWDVCHISILLRFVAIETRHGKEKYITWCNWGQRHLLPTSCDAFFFYFSTRDLRARKRLQCNEVHAVVLCADFNHSLKPLMVCNVVLNNTTTQP